MSQNSSEIIKYWIEKSYRTLEVAKYDFKGGFLESTLDRLYYSAFYIVLAYLTLKNEKFKKHSGVKSFFFREIIKQEKLDKAFGKLYNKLYYLREEADYKPNPVFEKEDVKNIIKDTEKFIKVMENLIKEELKDV